MTITRLAFFKWLAAAVGLQEPLHTLVGGLKGWQDTCVTTKGFQRPCEFKEGWEECPVGHYQKPRIVRLQQVYEMPCLRYLDGKPVDDSCNAAGASPFEPRVCSVCGIVYVPIATPKEK